MQKAYQRINWENDPSTATPLGASNLLPLDSAIDEIDDRVVQHDAEIQQLFTSVSNGKTLIASAITDKGIPTDATATFAKMAQNIERIPVGGGLLRIEASDIVPAITFGNFWESFTERVNVQNQAPPTTGLHLYYLSTSTTSSPYTLLIRRYVDGWYVEDITMNFADYNGSWRNFDDVIRIGGNVGGGSSYWTLEILGNVEGYTVGQKVNWSRTSRKELTLQETEV